MTELSQGRRRPVTDPLRVVIIDPSVTSRQALGRAIDLDPELAIVGLYGDPRRAPAEIRRAAPDVIAVRLHIDDAECTELLAELARSGRSPAVVVLGRPSNVPGDAGALVARIKAVVTAGRAGASAPRSAVPRHTPAGDRLH